jgi:hypothetical protein
MGEKFEWYLPVSQVADILHCNWREVYKLVAMGRLAYIRMPKSGIRISEKSVCGFMGHLAGLDSIGEAGLEDILAGAN